MYEKSRNKGINFFIVSGLCFSMLLVLYIAVAVIINITNPMHQAKREERRELEAYIEELHQYINDNKDSFNKVINYEKEQYDNDNNDNKISVVGEFQEDRNIIFKKLNSNDFSIYYDKFDNNNPITVSYSYEKQYYTVLICFYDTSKEYNLFNKPNVTEKNYVIYIYTKGHN